MSGLIEERVGGTIARYAGGKRFEISKRGEVVDHIGDKIKGRMCDEARRP